MQDRTILITGGTGTFGSACLETLLAHHNPKKVIIFSRDEKKQWDLQQKFTDPRVRWFIGDIRDKERLIRAFPGVDYVIHAAALKQVPQLEYNPCEAVKTNIMGTQNIINAAIDAQVKKVIMLSSDKACSPINLYGATKLCAEKLIIASNVYSHAGQTLLSVVRYGNVLGSRGSVIEVWKQQQKTGLIHVTDKRMTRFWITIQDAVDFVLACLNIMEGGEIFVPKMAKKSIMDLARDVCPDCEIEETGIRVGEKLSEVLISLDESKYVVEKNNYYFISKSLTNHKSFVYSSNSS